MSQPGGAAATLVLSPAHERWSVRMWAGENRASAAGALALWPFDGVAAAIGTRLAANGSFEMRHCGAALNGGPANKRGWDGGVALWALEPVGRYESWRATLFGLGRDDNQVREVPSKRTLLAGIRVAYTMPVGKRTPRVEVVQWAPLSWPTTSQSVSAAAADPSATTSATLASGRTWGGTILRVSI